MHATLQSHLSAQRTQDLRDEARRDARAREALTARQTERQPAQRPRTLATRLLSLLNLRPA